MPCNVEEDNSTVGSHGYADQTAEIRLTSVLECGMQISHVSHGALTAVWPKSYTRGAICNSTLAEETIAPWGQRVNV